MKPNFSATINYICAIINFITCVYGIFIQNGVSLINFICGCFSLYIAYLFDKEYVEYLLNKLKVWLQK